LSDHEGIHEKAQQLILDEMFLMERFGHSLHPKYSPLSSSFPDVWFGKCGKCLLDAVIYFTPNSKGAFGASRMRGFCPGLPIHLPDLIKFPIVSLSLTTPPVDPNYISYSSGPQGSP
jgi:hypothetical protein